MKELRRLAPELKETCRRLAALGLPSTLVHGDLHMLNVARVDGRLVYFDWSDACIAHPFIDLLSLLSGRTRRSARRCSRPTWSPGRGPSPAEAVALAAVVIPLHHAVSYQHIVGERRAVRAVQLDATHMFLREALAPGTGLAIG